MASITYRLPWPPSTNSAWRHTGKVTYLTPKARQFRLEVAEIVADCEALRGRLFVGLELTLPDKRKRDIDNHIKSTLDAMMHAGVFVDDEQIDLLRVARLHVEPPGCCDVTITELAPAACVLVGE